MDAFAIEESQNLSLFFATNNSITNMIKKSLEEVCSVCVCVLMCAILCCVCMCECVAGYGHVSGWMCSVGVGV